MGLDIETGAIDAKKESPLVSQTVSFSSVNAILHAVFKLYLKSFRKPTWIVQYKSLRGSQKMKTNTECVKWLFNFKNLWFLTSKTN